MYVRGGIEGVLWILIRIDFSGLDLDPDPRRQKMTHKNKKVIKKILFLSAGCSLLMAWRIRKK